MSAAPGETSTTHAPSRRRPADFRDDIQGMRAIGVLAIILYHADYSPYPGGFVMLDMFFVVSGFLITYLLMREIERDGRLSLTKFYARRARRILPAATLVTVATVAASALWLNVSDAKDSAIDGVWAALFGANIRFAVEETDYFAQDSAQSPFQHYWSLSVEEQFYLVLPLLLVVCIVWARRGARRRDARLDVRTRIVVVVSAMTLLSLAWSLYASPANPETAYFSTFTRSWEFGVGALVALMAHRFGSLTSRARNLLTAGGVGLLLLSMWTFTEQLDYPGYAALVPVLATAAVMAAGAGVRGEVPLSQRLLGTRPLRYIGDASYSLYLWHWPLLTIAPQHLGRDLTAIETAGVVVLVFLLSWGTYVWVETPFRRYSPPKVSRALALYPLSLVLVLAGLGGSTAWIGQQIPSGAPITLADYAQGPDGKALDKDPTVGLVEASVRAAQDDREVPGDLKPDILDLKRDKADVGECDYSKPPEWSLCPQGDTDADRSIVLLGHSHGRAWIPSFDKIAEEAGYTTYYLVKPQCTPVRLDSVGRGGDVRTRCSEFNDWTQEQIEEIQPDLVAIAGSAPNGAVVDGEPTRDRQEILGAMRGAFADLIEDVGAYADEVAVLGAPPERATNPSRCLGGRTARLARCLDEPNGYAKRVTEQSRLATRDTDATYVDTAPWFCADGKCPAVVGNFISMRDTQHITTSYAEALAGPLGRELGLLPKRKPADR